jgi:gas vesicle protein
MSDNGSSGVGSFLGGIALGAVVGVVVGLLLAPQSGEETREMIKNKAGDIVERVKKVPSDLREKMKPSAE